MPYNIRKQKCKQSDGDAGSYTLSYTDNKGKKHRACHTSRKKARGQIAAIEGPRESIDAYTGLRDLIGEILKNVDHDSGSKNLLNPAEDSIIESIMLRIIREAKGGLSKDTRTKAADLENAIIDAVNDRNPKMFQTVALAIADALEAAGISGKASKPPKSISLSEKWKQYGGTDSTPKTDVLIGSTRISLKMGAGQFMSGESGETKATLMAALERTGLDAKIAEVALTSIKDLQKNVKYSAYVSELRKLPGYKTPEGDVSNPGRPGKEVKALMSQEAAQAKFQQDLLDVLDPQKNPGLKNAFVLESMDGMIKFDNGVGTASHLLCVAGESTIYDDKRGLAAVGKAASENLGSFFHIKTIDKGLAQKYASKVSIIVKFKTRSSGSSDVVGVMLKESDDFRVALKNLLRAKNESVLFEKSIKLIQEGMWDDLKGVVGGVWKKIKSLWEKFVVTIDNLVNDFIDGINSRIDEGVESLIDYLGIDANVDVVGDIDWFSA